MVDFRKSFLLAAMALAVGVGTASAQAPSCTATTGAVPELRSEGVEELTGSIVLVCSNIVPGVPANFDVSINNATVPITDRPNEGVVTVTDPTTNPPTVTSYFGVPISTNGGQFNNVLQFTGVQIPSASPTISFSGLRVNATPSYVPVNTGGFGQVLAVISVSNAVIPIQQVNNGFFVGIVLPGLAPITLGAAINLNSCTGAATATGASFTVGIPENFATAFKPQGPTQAVGGAPGTLQDSETGTVPGALQATTGTQFAVTFGAIPSGVTFYVPTTITSTAGGVAVLVNAEGSLTPTVGIVVAGLPTTYTYGAAASGATFFYNVTVSNPSVQETFNMPVYPVGTVTTSSGTPTVSVVLAPRNSVIPTDVPNFIALTTTNGNLPITFTACQTTLLFPYVTNQAGFDTGFSIASTSTDPFGTAPQSGTCTLSMYGANPPATAPVVTIPAAGEGHATISSIAPNFQGYVIAVCDFQYAHGYVFLSNGFSGIGNGALSEGYTANVIGTSRVYTSDGTAVSTPVLSTGEPETLGH